MWRPILACDRMWIWMNLQHMFPNYHEHIRSSICLLPSIRNALKRFRSKCWSSREAECSDSELRQRECLTDMDPTRILGAHSECKAAFLATVGTPLHRPCSCKGLNGGHLLTCSKIHSVFHNRSHFGEYSFDLKTGQNVQSTDFNTYYTYIYIIFFVFFLVPAFQRRPGKVLPNCLGLMNQRQIKQDPTKNIQAGGTSGLKWTEFANLFNPQFHAMEERNRRSSQTFDRVCYWSLGFLKKSEENFLLYFWLLSANPPL